MGKTLFRALISLGFLALLFYVMRGQLPTILGVLRHTNLTIFIAAFILLILAAWIASWRLQIIFAARNVPLGFWQCSNLNFIGAFFNNFLPTSLGGDLVKVMCASRISGQASRVVTSILADRVFGFFTIVLIPSLSFLFLIKTNAAPAVPIVIYSFLAISLMGFVLAFNRKAARRLSFVMKALDRFSFKEKIRKFYEEVHGFKNQKATVAQALILSLVSQGLTILVIYMISLSLGAPSAILDFLILIPIVFLVSMLPSVNGLGIREGAYLYFLSPSIGRENAAAMSVLWLAMLFLMSMIGGIIYLLRPNYHVRFKAKPLRSWGLP